MASASSFLTLQPQELLEHIAGFLEHDDVARLAECSDELCVRLGRILFDTHTKRDTTMWWACLYGLPRVARRAIACGASPSTVTVLNHGEIRGGYGIDDTGLTLQLAAYHGHAEVFRVLLDAGAGVPRGFADEMPQRKRALVQDLCGNAHGEFAQPFLESESAAKLTKDLLGLFLFSLIGQGNTGVDLVRLVLDLGGNPDYLPRALGEAPKSLLAIALTARNGSSTDVFQLLVDRGAKIDGPPDLRLCPFSSERSGAIPIYAAVDRRNLRKGDLTEVEMVRRLQTCVLAGANINQRMPIFGPLPIPYQGDYDGGYDGELNWDYFYGTPFLSYVSQIDDWSRVDIFWLKAVTQWFVDNGAILDVRLLPEFERHSLLGMGGLNLVQMHPPPTAPALLIGRWGMEKLAEPGFLGFVKFLLSRGAVCRERFAHFLATIEYIGDERVEQSVHFSAWKELIMAGVEFGKQSSRDFASFTLRDYVLRRVLLSSIHKSVRHAYIITCKTIDFLIDAGANINWHQDPHTPSVLLEVCGSYEAAQYGKQKSDFESEAFHYRHFFKILVDRGADRHMTRNDGKTALDIMAGVDGRTPN